MVVKTWTDRRQTALRVVLNAVWKQGSEEEHDGDSNDFIRTTPCDEPEGVLNKAPQKHYTHTNKINRTEKDRSNQPDNKNTKQTTTKREKE